MQFYVETYGCAANEFDSLIISSLLEKEGWKRSDLDKADLIIVNTCGVKKPTEDKILYRLKELKSLGKPILVAGCLTRINPRGLEEVGFNVAIDVNSINKVNEAAMYALKGASNKFILSEQRFDKPSLLEKKLTETIGVIEIQEGCAYNCTFCSTKLSRNGVYSFPDSSIVRAVSNLIKSGAVEIWLTGQDVAAYRYNSKDLADLINEISSVDSYFKVRVGMSTPPFFKLISKKLLNAFPEKVYQFFHIPVQSGSDRVLFDMKRGYKASLFVELVEEIRSKMPMATIETDIIVGYPTESEDDFEETIKLLLKTRPNVVNISKFWKRPNTEAAKLKELDSKVVARRSKEAYETVLKIMKEENEKWLGWEGEVLVTEHGEKKDTWKGRNFAYKVVVISDSEKNLLGKRVWVKVNSADSINLYAEPIYVVEEKAEAKY